MKKHGVVILSILLGIYLINSKPDFKEEMKISEVKQLMKENKNKKLLNAKIVKKNLMFTAEEKTILLSGQADFDKEAESSSEPVLIDQEPKFKNLSVYFDNMEEIEDELGQKHVYFPAHEEDGTRIQIKIKSSDWAKVVGKKEHY